MALKINETRNSLMSCINILLNPKMNPNETIELMDTIKTVRDEFDIMVVKAGNGTLSFNLPDLSPISVAKISIEENTYVAETSGTISRELTATTDDEEKEEKNSTLPLVLIILVLAVAAGAYFFIKKRHQAAYEGYDEEENENDDSV